MIEDLVGAGEVTAKADIVVIGAGTVGLIVCSMLARKGLSVICLESGGWRQDNDEHPLNEVVQTRSVYSGARQGRFRCLGGTSTRWGGMLIPFLGRDLKDAGWPISSKDIEKYLKDVEDLFGLTHDSYEFPDALEGSGTAYIARLAKSPSFSKRNVFNLFSVELRSNQGPRVWINATATTFKTEGHELRLVSAQAVDGSRITVQAKTFIFAAGAIETTRLLLLLNRQNGDCLDKECGTLGRYFHDHLSVVVGDLDLFDQVALNRLVGFRFDHGGTMRSLRFELSEGADERKSVPPCFVHIAFDDLEKSGFDALRDLFQFIQQRRVPSASALLRLAATAPWLARATWWRFVEKRLLYPDRAKIRVHAVIQQIPRRDNRILLAPSKLDIYGQPLAQIEWSVGDQDVTNLNEAVHVFQSTWNSSKLSSIAKFNRRPEREAADELALGGGIYHPGGSTRMSDDPSSGVVNKDLQVFGLTNVRVLATSVLPTGGGANPTMMLLMLSLRCVEQLSNAEIATAP